MSFKSSLILAATLTAVTSFGPIAAQAQNIVMTCTTDTGETVACPGAEAAHMTRAKIILGGGNPNDVRARSNNGSHNLSQVGNFNPQPQPTLGHADYGMSPTQ